MRSYRIYRVAAAAIVGNTIIRKLQIAAYSWQRSKCNIRAAFRKF